jgi:hypothetical protein
MKMLLGLLVLLPIISPPFWASQYAPGVMERVVEWRERHGQLLDSTVEPVGFIAVRDCDEIGNIWWLRQADSSSYFLPFQVADCSGHKTTTEWMTRNNIQVELSYPLAVFYRTVGHGFLMERCYEHCHIGWQLHSKVSIEEVSTPVVERYSRWRCTAD